LQKKGIGRGYFYKIFEDLSNMNNIAKKYQELLKEGLIQRPATQNIHDNLANIYKVKLCFPWEINYPKLLLQIYQPPVVLFYKGELENKDMVSIVGTRKASDYGKRFTKQLAERLAEANYGIVSGMAMGIDREAHMGA